MLWVLPLEPLEERYTEQWWRWTEEKLEDYGIEFSYISADPMTFSVITGKVLDASSTIAYKADQIHAIAHLFRDGEIKDGDKFFLFDGQFPGVESIRYMAELYGIKIEIYCYFHASSYTIEDFTSLMTDWLKWFEIAWFGYYDKIFIGTNYHKNTILARRWNILHPLWVETMNDHVIETPKKFIVTGSMYDSTEVLEHSDSDGFKYLKPTIIWPNRFDYEKRPLMLRNLAEKHPEWDIIITTSRAKLTSDPNCIQTENDLRLLPNVKIYTGLKKTKYYEIMSRCHVFLTTSIEENFGICLLEAITLGLHPIARKGLSHSEILHNRKDCLYESADEMEELIAKALNKPQIMPKDWWLKYDWSIDRILFEMGLIKEEEIPKKYRSNCLIIR